MPTTQSDTRVARSDAREQAMIIDFRKRCDPAGSDTGLAALRGYWEALRIGTALPQRAAIDPRGLKTCLHQILIAEQIAPGLARLRIAGSAFTDVMDMEVAGMPLSALFEPMARSELERVLATVFAGKTAVTLYLVAERGLGRPALAGHMLLLPMIGDSGRVDLVIGCLALQGTTGRAPRRFHIAEVQQSALLDAPAVAKPAPVLQFAEAAVAYRPAPPAPFLRVVK